MIYSFNGSYPTALPNRIRLSNGLTRTDNTTFTPEEIEDAGFFPVLVPDYDPSTHKLAWNGATFDIVIIPPPVNWDEWNELMLNDSNFSNVCSIVNNSNPLILAGLPAALTQVNNGQTTMFEKLFNYVCLIGGATQSMRDSWGIYATNCGLPLEFVNIIIGV